MLYLAGCKPISELKGQLSATKFKTLKPKPKFKNDDNIYKIAFMTYFSNCSTGETTADSYKMEFISKRETIIYKSERRNCLT